MNSKLYEINYFETNKVWQVEELFQWLKFYENDYLSLLTKDLEKNIPLDVRNYSEKEKFLTIYEEIETLISYYENEISLSIDKIQFDDKDIGFFIDNYTYFIINYTYIDTERFITLFIPCLDRKYLKVYKSDFENTLNYIHRMNSILSGM